MDISKKGKPYDLRERAFLFATQVVQLVNKLPKTVAGYEIGRQLVRSATSVGANLEEADDAASVKDFIYKTGISRREAKESRYWLKLLNQSKLYEGEDAKELKQESEELVRILSSIITKVEKNKENLQKSKVRDVGGWLKTSELV